MGETSGTVVTLDGYVPDRLARWRPPLVYGFAAGVGTYAVVVLFLVVEILTMAQGGLGGVGGRSFLFGSLGDFFAPHVGLAGPVSLGIGGVGTVPEPLYYAIAPALLGWAGRLSARNVDLRTDTGSLTDTGAAVAGAHIAAGYLAAVSLGLAVLGVAARFQLLALDPLRALLVAGLVYPLVFGTLGGYSIRVW